MFLPSAYAKRWKSGSKHLSGAELQSDEGIYQKLDTIQLKNTHKYYPSTETD